jgi:hypothetical protein
MSFDPTKLRDAEIFVLTETMRGAIADFTIGQWPRDPKPAIRAAFLRHLLLGLPHSNVDATIWTVRLPGVRVKGATLEGDLDLKDCAGSGADGLPALELLDCDVPSMIDISHARLARFAMSGSAFKYLRARDARIQGPLEFKGVKPYAEGDGAGHGFIDASGAFIEGDVNCQDAHLRAPDARPDHDRKPGESVYALRLSEAYIRGSLNLARTNAIGGISLSTAQIGGELWARTLMVTAGENYALNARAAKVGGAVVLIEGSKAIGDVSFAGALVGGPFVMSRDQIGALNPTKVKEGATIEGLLNLREARINGSMELGGAFINRNGWAIDALGVRIGGDLFFTPSGASQTSAGAATRIVGGAKFERARIEGKVAWDGLLLEGEGPDDIGYRAIRDRYKCCPPILNFSDASIHHTLNARLLDIDPKGDTKLGAIVDLTGADCSALDDRVKPGWGGKRCYLKLEGFTYGRLEPDEGKTPAESKSDRWQERRKWLNKHYHAFNDFHPQPYAQLASFYESIGWMSDMSAARQMQRWRQIHADWKRGRISLQSLFSWVYGLVAGFGYEPVRLSVILLVYLVLGGYMVERANDQGRLVREIELTETEALRLADQQLRAAKNEAGGGALPGEAEPPASSGLVPRCGDQINPYVYALDVAIPLIDFRQEVQCEIGSAPRLNGGDAPAAPGDVFVWRLYKALYAFFGAILTALAVITYSGALRRRLER